MPMGLIFFYYNVIYFYLKKNVSCCINLIMLDDHNSTH